MWVPPKILEVLVRRSLVDPALAVAVAVALLVPAALAATVAPDGTIKAQAAVVALALHPQALAATLVALVMLVATLPVVMVVTAAAALAAVRERPLALVITVRLGLAAVVVGLPKLPEVTAVTAPPILFGPRQAIAQRLAPAAPEQALVMAKRAARLGFMVGVAVAVALAAALALKVSL